MILSNKSKFKPTQSGLTGREKFITVFYRMMLNAKTRCNKKRRVIKLILKSPVYLKSKLF